MNIFNKLPKRASLSVDRKDSMLSEKRKGTVRTVEVDPEEHLDCPICQDPVGIRSESGILEHWAYLPCNHKFGRECIRKYIGSVATDRPLCPICRAPAYHICGHPVLPQPPGIKFRPTTETCLFCEECRVACRQYRFKRWNVCGRLLWKVMPRKTKRRVRAAEARRLREYVPWHVWWFSQDRQPLQQR